MAIPSSPRDNNRVASVMVTSNADGVTPLLPFINPTTHAMKISNGTTGSGFSYVNAERDANRIPVLWGVSATDGRTPVPIYGDSVTNNLLVRST